MTTRAVHRTLLDLSWARRDRPCRESTPRSEARASVVRIYGQMRLAIDGLLEPAARDKSRSDYGLPLNESVAP